MTILSWYENHPADDVPPEHLWEDPEGLTEHWDKVKERQERKFSNPGKSAPVPEGEEMGGNELAAALRD